jgi:hypothetical protein
MNGPRSPKLHVVQALLVFCVGVNGCTTLARRPAARPVPSQAPAPAHEPRATEARAEPDFSAAATTLAPANQEPAAERAALEPPAAAIELVTESPYKLYERVIPAGEVYAAGLEEELARWNLGGCSDPSHPANRAGFHPGTRVIVDLLDAPRRLPQRTPRDRRTGKPRAVLSHESLLAQARKYGYWPSRLCFEEAASSERDLKGGATHLRVRVAASGRVTQTRVVQSELKDSDVPGCLARRLERLRFSPAPARAFDATFEVEVYPGDAPLPRRQHAKHAPATARDNPGRLVPALVEQALASEERTIARCFADALARDQGLWGRLELRIELDGAGSCTQVSEHDSRFPDREAASCVADAVRRVHFPAPTGGKLSFIQAWRVGHLPASPEANP